MFTNFRWSRSRNRSDLVSGVTTAGPRFRMSRCRSSILVRNCTPQNAIAVQFACAVRCFGLALLAHCRPEQSVSFAGS